MRVSRNEMVAALSRAYEGAGYHIGDYEDAAQSVTWIQMTGLSGFENIETPPPGPKGGATPRLVFEDVETAVIDAGGADVCEHGSLAANLACSKAVGGGLVVVQLSNCRNAQLLLRSLSLVAQRGLYISAYWRDVEGDHGASFEAGAIFPNYWFVATGNTAADIETSKITILCTKTPSLLADAIGLQTERPEIVQHKLSATQLATNYEQALEQGIKVPKEHWKILNEAAWPILVPSDDLSRAGAGPG